MKKVASVVSLLALVGLIGCAGIEPPMPDKLLTHPLGTSPIHLGMTKNEVKEILGEPDSIQSKGDSEDKGLTKKEEWVYNKRMKNLPVNYGYLARSMYIYFDGDNVTSVKEE